MIETASFLGNGTQKRCLLCGSYKMALNNSHGHNIEYSTGICVLWIGKLFITPDSVVGVLYLPIYLSSVCTFEVDAVVAMGFDCTANIVICSLFLNNLFDI